MQTFIVTARQAHKWGKNRYHEGDEVARIETDLPQFMLFDGVASGRLCVAPEGAAEPTPEPPAKPAETQGQLPGAE